MRSGTLRSIVLAQQDVSLAASYLASQVRRGQAQVALHNGGASVRATFALPANPLGRYLNLDMVVSESARLPRVDQLRIGRLPVPSWIANAVLDQGLQYLQGSRDFDAAADVIRQVRMRDGMLSVQFAWSDAAARQIKAVLVPAEDQERWKAYQARLVDVLATSARGPRVPMEQLLVPLMQLAAQRSAGGDAVAENRAALLVLAFYINGKGLGALVPAATAWPAPPPRQVTLAGRTDFPQHFSISAALAGTAGSPLSDAVGLYKEVDDSRGGSGFSFNDMGADRAGTRFGEAATRSDGAARQLQRRAAEIVAQSEFFPEVADLPEFMTEAEFKRRFGGIGQPAYQRMMADIERRVAALPALRGLP